MALGELQDNIALLVIFSILMKTGYDRFIFFFRKLVGVAYRLRGKSLLCISTTGSNDLERSDTKLEAPSFRVEYKIYFPF